MSLDTYANLKTAIADFVDLAEADLALDDFIDMTESDLNKRLRVPEMVTRATATASTSSRFLAVPTGYLQMLKLRIDSTIPHLIEYVAPAQLETFYVNAQGKPGYFTVVGDEMEFNRSFDSAYTLQMHYYKTIAALSGSNTTNDILTNYPELYLYGCLVHSAPYLQEDQRISTWASLYENGIAEANKMAKDDQHNAGPMVMRHDYTGVY